MPARIGVDVGGTFTDVVLALPGGRIVVNKTTTTPQDPGEGVAAGIAAVIAEAGLAAGQVTEIVHGTTVASNTILQKAGARTGLLTTQGFRDVLEIGRIRTPGMFDMTWRKPEPLVPRRWRLEARERTAADGSVVTPLDAESVREAAAFFLAEGVEAVAICFINSYAHPAHERAAAALLRAAAPQLLVTASCEVLPEIKEYERTSTAVVNAYLLPAMRGYLSRLQQRLAAIGITAPVQVMASNGGMIGLDAARERPVFAVGSGPAGGVAGAARLGDGIGAADLIVFDMGGTTAKAAIIEGGQPSLVTEYEFRDGISTPSRFVKGAGYMLKVPAIDIAEVGSGGGSIARIDAGGLLVVGPQSAGGDPGPACYGRGNAEPTVTDANMVLGYLNPTALAGGSLRVDAALSREAIARRIAGPLKLSVEEAAHGIRQIANVNMARAIRAVTVERGKDPRDLALMAFGGGGPLHAVNVARLLGIRRVLISPVAGVFSAAGMLAAEAVHEFVHPLLMPLAQVTPALLQAARASMAQAGHAALAHEGYAKETVELRYAADLRYAGQSSQLTVPVGDFAVAALHAGFERLYGETFGYTAAGEGVELVNLRLSAIGRAEGRIDFPSLALDARALAGAVGERLVSFARGEAPVPTRLLPRAALADGPVHGPAILESYDTTIIVPPGCTARAAGSGTVVIEMEAADA
ncbi:hydantoinase/oxoprolinase family protein [Roseococcus sp. SDR]|uniref:hydantoinase/oxoprolinase family protein n=1 Tax=Roseococcus sp. SDR TaxID=2835532 RepID=UPI001BD0053C|nr:hydantoinase/oxoprolinase family protein [Roseococcus sp. SDR]MBS7789474.1 hydantoinase/oxoprolinase family protein [Roseococcus sp. SDR]MBV1844788.1 hydantoinase/oxoprolinase family protein [Roseococcus sp. SDR]